MTSPTLRSGARSPLATMASRSRRWEVSSSSSIASGPTSRCASTARSFSAWIVSALHRASVGRRDLAIVLGLIVPDRPTPPRQALRQRVLEGLEPEREVREEGLSGPSGGHPVAQRPEADARESATEGTPALAHPFQQLR